MYTLKITSNFYFYFFKFLDKQSYDWCSKFFEEEETARNFPRAFEIVYCCVYRLPPYDFKLLDYNDDDVNEEQNRYFNKCKLNVCQSLGIKSVEHPKNSFKPIKLPVEGIPSYDGATASRLRNISHIY